MKTKGIPYVDLVDFKTYHVHQRNAFVWTVQVEIKSPSKILVRNCNATTMSSFQKMSMTKEECNDGESFRFRYVL